MSIKLNGATNGSIELDVPAAIGSDLNVTLPATAGEIVVANTSGDVDLGGLTVSGSAADDSVSVESSGRLKASLGMAVTRNIDFDAAGWQVHFNTDTVERALVDFNFGCTDLLDSTTGTRASRLKLQPAGQLQLERNGGTANELFTLIGKTTVDASYSILKFVGDSDAVSLINDGAGDYAFINDGINNKIRIADSTGGIIIHYAGDSTKHFNISSSGVVSQYIYNTTSSATSNLLRITGATSGYTIQRSTSSRRYKDNIEDYTGGLSRIATISPRTWNDHKSGERCVGFIAEELHEAGYTDAVSYDSWQGGSEVGIGDDPSPMTGNGTSPVTKTGEPLADEVEVVENISDRTIICDLVLAVQELTARISALEST
jgi:hypothetical protein